MLNGYGFSILLVFLWLTEAGRICVEPCTFKVPLPASHLQPGDVFQDMGVLAPSFSLMLQCSSACYMHGPISTCYWGLLTATVDNRIRCSYLMRFSVNHIWVRSPGTPSLPCCCFRLLVILWMHIACHSPVPSECLEYK